MRPSEDLEDEYYEAIIYYILADLRLSAVLSASGRSGPGARELREERSEYDLITDEMYESIREAWNESEDGDLVDWNSEVWERARQSANRMFTPPPPPKPFMLVDLSIADQVALLMSDEQEQP